MTPRRADAWLYHGAVQFNRELASLVNVIAAGARADQKEITKILKNLQSDLL